MLDINKYDFFPFNPIYRSDSFEFFFKKIDSFFLYQRKVSELDFYSQIISVQDITKIYLQPSEPFAEGFDTRFLLLKFTEPLLLLPDSSLEGYVDFPISLSLFIIDNQNKIHHINTFSLLKPKLALYGNPHNGKICRFWESSFSSSIPNEKPFATGVLQLYINNPTSSKIIITRLVLDFSFMELYFKFNSCKTSARVKIVSDKFAETEFITPRDIEGYSKSIDLIPTRILTSSKFLMEFGL